MTPTTDHRDRAASPRRRPGPSRAASALLLAVGLVLAACAGGEQADGPVGVPLEDTRPGFLLPPPADRAEAPDVGLWPTVADEDAQEGFEQLRGEVVVVNFWASWCGPCRAEQPDLNEAHADLQDQPVAWLGVAFREDPRPNAAAHQREFDVPYPSLHDPDNRIAAAWDITAIPSTVILDRDGRIAARLVGVTTRDEVVAIATRLATEGA